METEMSIKVQGIHMDLASNKLPMKAYLPTIIPSIEPRCPWHRANPEDGEHLFFHCPMSQIIWHRIVHSSGQIIVIM